jgi:transposase
MSEAKVLKGASTMEIKSSNIDHLGIISSICDEIGLVETINRMVPQDKTTKLSIGSRVKAMIINGLGFTGRPLYLTPQFFNKRPVGLLVGENATADALNDDALGRSLDALYENNAELIFSAIAKQAVKVYKVKTNVRHLDTSSMSVDGKYLKDEGIGIIRFGHSKDMRADLKQMILSSLVTNDGGIPLVAKVLPGNTSDAKHFRNALSEMQNNIAEGDESFTVVFDAAGYNKETIEMLTSVTWISRVPDTIGEAKQLKDSIDDNKFEKLENGYSIYETTSEYGGVKQRWFLIFSQQALDRVSGTIDRNVASEYSSLEGKLKKLSSQKFSCCDDARKAFDKFNISKYHKIELIKITEQKSFLKRGKPKNSDPFKLEYCIEAKMTEDTDKIIKAKKYQSKFIIATNELCDKKMNKDCVLKTYKEQSHVESGFRFLKNPVCMTDSVNLKKQSRIIALGMLMFLCLLVYAIAERALRIALEQNNETIPNQVNKPTKKPTMRWVFQMMECIIVNEFIEDGKHVIQFANLNDVLKKIIILLGSACMKIYNIYPQPSTA